MTVLHTNLMKIMKMAMLVVDSVSAVNIVGVIGKEFGLGLVNEAGWENTFVVGMDSWCGEG